MNRSRFDRLATVTQHDLGGTSTVSDREVIVESAEVTRVDEVLGVIDVFSKITGRRCVNIDIGGEGFDRNGGMMGAMPMVGDLGLIVHPSDSDIPKLLRCFPYIDPRTGARGKRRYMRAGDKMMSTMYGNYVHVHAGGVVDVAANPVTRRMYVPVLNQIKDFCENYMLHAGGGRFRWEVRREDRSSTGSRTEAIWELKSTTGGQVVAEIRQGSVSGVTDLPGSVLESRRFFGPTGTQDEVLRAVIDDNGNAFVSARGGSTESHTGQRIIAAQGGVTLSGSGVQEFDQNVPAGRSRFRVSENGGVELAGAQEPGVLGQRLLTSLTACTNAVVTALGAVSAAGTALAAATTEPLAAPFGTTVAASFQTAAQQLTTEIANFAKFLAADTKLS